MVKGKKITKKQMKKPDEFMSLTSRAIDFSATHLKKIAFGGAAALVILLAIIGFEMWEGKKERDAAQSLNSALGLYQTVDAASREGSAADYKSLLEKFDQITRDFPGTSSGKLSLLYQGNIHLNLGEFDAAIKTYEAFLARMGGERLYALLALDGLGYAYEGKKEYERAIDNYRRMIAMGESFESGEAYLRLGSCYEKLGKSQEALENYKTFLKGEPKSLMRNVILRKVSLLEK